jgi:hypothetical protein
MTLHKTLSSPIRATCPAYLILLDFITRTILGEEYKSFSLSLCNILHSPVTSSLLGPNILLNTLFSNTLYAITKIKKTAGQIQCQQVVWAISGGLNHNKTFEESQIFYGIYKYLPSAPPKVFLSWTEEQFQLLPSLVAV